MRWRTAGQFASKSRLGGRKSRQLQSADAEIKEKGRDANLERELPQASLATASNRKHRSPSHMQGMISHESRPGNSVITKGKFLKGSANIDSRKNIRKARSKWLERRIMPYRDFHNEDQRKSENWDRKKGWKRIRAIEYEGK